jgi:hypothetical protein
MRINIKFAQKWNELSEFQIKMIGGFMFNSRNERTDKIFFKHVVVCILLIPKLSFKNVFKAIVLFSKIPINQLEDYANFVFDTKELLTRFPKKIKIGRWPFRKTVYGPAPRMANSTIEELSYADTFYYKWVTGKDIDDLHRLTAILYRIGNNHATPDDVRLPFSSLTLDTNSRITDAIPLHLKFMIAHAYQGCRQSFINRYKNVFPQKPIDENEEVKKTPIKSKPYQPFSKIIDSFAMDEIQVFGNHQQVEKVYASKFLSLFDTSIVREREKERNRSLNK